MHARMMSLLVMRRQGYVNLVPAWIMNLAAAAVAVAVAVLLNMEMLMVIGTIFYTWSNLLFFILAKSAGEIPFAEFLYLTLTSMN